VLALVLVGAWWFVRARGAGADARGDGDSARRATGPAPVIPRGSMPIERVDRIELRRDGAVMSFERRDDGWWQREPFEQPAEGGPLRELLVRIADLHAARSAPIGTVDLAALGLEPPKAEVIIAMNEGDGAVESETAPQRSMRLELGGRGVGGRAWLRVDDGPALAVDAALHDAVLEADARRLRSWRLFDAIGAGTERIVVERTPAESSRPEERFELVRNDGRWRMVAPFDTRVDGTTVDALLGALAKVEHAGFADEAPRDLALFGLERPIASVEIRSRRRESSVVERLEIGSALAQGGAICARRVDRPPIVLLDQTSLAALMPSPAVFVDPRPCGLLPEDVRRVRIRDASGAQRVALERTLDGWRIVDGAEGPATPRDSGAAAAPESSPGAVATRPARESAVRDLLERLCVARAPELALQPMPPELVVATIELEPSIGGTVTVRVAREGDQGKWALDESDDVLRVFPPSFALPLDARDFTVSTTR